MMSGEVLEARGKLTKDMSKVYRKYQDLVETLKENLMEFATKTWQGASYSRIFETC